VAAQEVAVRIDCARGIRPVRVLGRDADIAGRRVTANINQLYSGQEKYILLEVEVPASSHRSTRNVATVSVTYANMATNTTDRLTSTVAARFTDVPKLVEREINTDVAVAALTLVANDRSRLAVALRDKGQIEEAKKLLNFNWIELNKYGKKYDSSVLMEQAVVNVKDAEGLEKEEEWQGKRKSMRRDQHNLDAQQTWK
jgi:Ca-activated chloride channel family protein